MMRLLFVLLLSIVDGVGLAQTMRYHFKEGEHIQYHYSLKVETDRMFPNRRLGALHEFNSIYECDPEFDIQQVDSLGGALMEVLLRNRYMNFPHWNKHLVYTNMIPLSQMFITSDGHYLTGRVIVDDTLRTRTKGFYGVIPEAKLLSDKDLLFWTARRIWYAWDTLPADLDSFTVTRTFDTAIHNLNETTFWTRGANEPVVTVESIESNHSGTTTYTMRDTIIDGLIYSDLHFVTSSIIGATHFQSTVRLKGELVHGSTHEINGDVFFRKSDGIPWLWKVNVETHNGGKFAQYSEMEMRLKKIEIVH